MSNKTMKIWELRPRRFTYLGRKDWDPSCNTSGAVVAARTEKQARRVASEAGGKIWLNTELTKCEILEGSRWVVPALILDEPHYGYAMPKQLLKDLLDKLPALLEDVVKEVFRVHLPELRESKKHVARPQRQADRHRGVHGVRHEVLFVDTDHRSTAGALGFHAIEVCDPVVLGKPEYAKPDIFPGAAPGESKAGRTRRGKARRTASRGRS